jgi:hypothetical protein
MLLKIVQLFPLENCIIVSSCQSVSIFQRGQPHFTQLIFVVAKDNAEIVRGFDLPCNMVWFDGENFQFLPEWENAVATKTMQVNTTFGRDGQNFSERRIERAISRGWTVERNSLETGRNTPYDNSRTFSWLEVIDEEMALCKLKEIFNSRGDKICLLKDFVLDHSPLPLNPQLSNNPSWLFSFEYKRLVLETFSDENLLERSFQHWESQSLQKCLLGPFGRKLFQMSDRMRRKFNTTICFPGYTWQEILNMYCYDEIEENVKIIKTLETQVMDVSEYDREHGLGAAIQNLCSFDDSSVRIRQLPKLMLNNVNIQLVSELFYYDTFAIVALNEIQKWMPWKLLERFKNCSRDFILRQKNEFRNPDLKLYFERERLFPLFVKYPSLVPILCKDTRVFLCIHFHPRVFESLQKHPKMGEFLKINLIWGPGICQTPDRLHFTAVL